MQFLTLTQVALIATTPLRTAKRRGRPDEVCNEKQTELPTWEDSLQTAAHPVPLSDARRDADGALIREERQRTLSTRASTPASSAPRWAPTRVPQGPFHNNPIADVDATSDRKERQSGDFNLLRRYDAQLMHDPQSTFKIYVFPKLHRRQP
jgi:hypothetical protein